MSEQKYVKTFEGFVNEYKKKKTEKPTTKKSKVLAHFKLGQPDESDKRTLVAYLVNDDKLVYYLYTGWDDKGTPLSLDVLQLKEELPQVTHDENFKELSANELEEKILDSLETSKATKVQKVITKLNKR